MADSRPRHAQMPDPRRALGSLRTLGYRSRRGRRRHRSSWSAPPSVPGSTSNSPTRKKQTAPSGSGRTPCPRRPRRPAQDLVEAVYGDDGHRPRRLGSLPTTQPPAATTTPLRTRIRRPRRRRRSGHRGATHSGPARRRRPPTPALAAASLPAAVEAWEADHFGPFLGPGRPAGQANRGPHPLDDPGPLVDLDRPLPTRQTGRRPSQPPTTPSAIMAAVADPTLRGDDRTPHRSSGSSPPTRLQWAADVRSALRARRAATLGRPPSKPSTPPAASSGRRLPDTRDPQGTISRPPTGRTGTRRWPTGSTTEPPQPGCHGRLASPPPAAPPK